MPTWRTLPHIAYKIPDNEGEGEKSGFKLILILLNLALIKTFKDEKYKKFGIFYSASYENGMCNIEIFSPEVEFLANFEKMISGVIDMNQLESLISSNMGKFSKIIYSLPLGETLAACIVYDGQAGKITFGEDKLQMDVSTTSGILFHIANMLQRAIIWDETGFIFEYENYRKLMIYNMDHGRIEFDRIKINTNNFEEWDYYCPEYDQEVKENELIYGTNTKTDIMREKPEEMALYDVALSFAGEDRPYVEEVAECLKKSGVKVFYDKYEQATLWGKDLYEHLDKIYGGNALYCIMFISENYKNKLWTTHERRSAFAKAFKEKEEYILPARFDDTEIDGLRDTVGYIDLTDYNPKEFGMLILEKLGRTT